MHARRINIYLVVSTCTRLFLSAKCNSSNGRGENRFDLIRFIFMLALLLLSTQCRLSAGTITKKNNTSVDKYIRTAIDWHALSTLIVHDFHVFTDRFKSNRNHAEFYFICEINFVAAPNIDSTDPYILLSSSLLHPLHSALHIRNILMCIKHMCLHVNIDR